LVVSYAFLDIRHVRASRNLLVDRATARITTSHTSPTCQPGNPGNPRLDAAIRVDCHSTRTRSVSEVEHGSISSLARFNAIWLKRRTFGFSGRRLGLSRRKQRLDATTSIRFLNRRLGLSRRELRLDATSDRLLGDARSGQARHPSGQAQTAASQNRHPTRCRQCVT
jgi:hypothetical protein